MSNRKLIQNQLERLEIDSYRWPILGVQIKSIWRNRHTGELIVTLRDNHVTMHSYKVKTLLSILPTFKPCTIKNFWLFLGPHKENANT